MARKFAEIIRVLQQLKSAECIPFRTSYPLSAT